MNDQTLQSIHDQLVKGIQDYCINNGFKTAVVGCSGGLDSAVVLALAVKALGAKNVTAITMPSTYSSTGSVTHSEELCKNLGLQLGKKEGEQPQGKLLYSKIQEEVELALKNYKADINADVRRLTIENLQARIRGLKLMTFSNNEGALILNTSNKSETMTGYFTMGGDALFGLEVIAGLYKTEVFELARWMNKDQVVIPWAIINKKPSAELWEGQTDEAALGTYEQLDKVLREMTEGLLPARHRDMPAHPPLTGYEAKIIGIVERNKFKQRYLAPSIEVAIDRE